MRDIFNQSFTWCNLYEYALCMYVTHIYKMCLVLVFFKSIFSQELLFIMSHNNETLIHFPWIVDNDSKKMVLRK